MSDQQDVPAPPASAAATAVVREGDTEAATEPNTPLVESDSSTYRRAHHINGANDDEGEEPALRSRSLSPEEVLIAPTWHPWSSNAPPSPLVLTFPWWYHLLLNLLEPLTTLLGLAQLFFWPRTFLGESLPTLVPYYSREGMQPVLTELAGAWTLVLFIEVVLLSPIRGVSPIPYPLQELFFAGGAGANGQAGYCYSLRLSLWRYCLSSLLVSDCISCLSLAQENPQGWQGVLLPWKWRSSFEASTVLLTVVATATRIAFLAGVGIEEGGSQEEATAAEASRGEGRLLLA